MRCGSPPRTVNFCYIDDDGVAKDIRVDKKDLLAQILCLGCLNVANKK